MTITTKEFITWLKTQGLTDLYGGYIPKNKEQVIGVYARKDPDTVNGYNSTYGIKGFTLLIHWTKGLYETEEKAIELHDLLDRAKYSNATHNGWISCDGNPVDAGKDENGVCEWVLDVTVYVKNN